MLWSSWCAVQTCPDSVPTPQDPHHPSSVFPVTPRHRSFHVMKSGYISCLLLSARRLVLTVFPGLRVVSASVKGISHPPHPWAACRRQRTEVVGPSLFLLPQLHGPLWMSPPETGSGVDQDGEKERLIWFGFCFLRVLYIQNIFFLMFPVCLPYHLKCLAFCGFLLL